MRIFLTGGTGYIGHAVLDALLRAGHEVRALVRSPERAEQFEARGVKPILGELASPNRYAKHVAGLDAYVHAAFDASPRAIELDRLTMENLINFGRASAKYRPVAVVYTSGIWVLGSCPEPVDETAPVDPIPHVAWRPAHERMVLDAAGGNLRTIVVRPGIVYGRSRGIVSGLLKDADNGLIRVVGSGENHWPVVYDRDLGELYARVLAEPTASGVYHATDESEERVNEIVEAIVAAAPQPPSVRFVPIDEMRKKLGTYADALALDQLIRSPRARALGWAPSMRAITVNAPGLFEEFRRDRKGD